MKKNILSIALALCLFFVQNSNAQRRVNVVFLNTSNKRNNYDIRGRNEGGGRFSYGFGLRANEQQKEYLPVGTQIFRNGQLIYTVQEADNEQVIKL